MADQRDCPDCGSRLDGSRSKCPECGADVDGESAVVTVMPTRDTDATAGAEPARLVERGEERAITVVDYPTVSIDVTVDSVDDASMDRTDFGIVERGREREVRSVGLSRPSLDLAVVFDDTGSMGGEIAAMQRGVKDLTDAVANRGIDARYALVSFKDDPEVDLPFTRDPEELKAAVDELRASGGGDAPEDCFGGVEAALGLDRRPEATDVFLAITDAPAHYRKDGSGTGVPVLSSLADRLTGSSDHTLAEVADDLRAADVDFVAVSPDSDDAQTSVKTLAAEAGGLWTDIGDEEFDRVLDRVTSLLASTYTVDYWTGLDAGETADVEVVYEHPTRGTGRDTCTVSVPEDP